MRAGEDVAAFLRTINLVEIVQQTTSLEPIWLGSCPFHGDTLIV